MRLRTIGLISSLVLGLSAAPLPAKAQQAGKVYRIGYQGGVRARGGRRYDVFRQRLRELGYVEGQNLVIEYRQRVRAQAPKLAAEFVRLKVDVVVAQGTSVIRALQRATRTIPIVMRGTVVDPVEAGFVESLARPGGNITGLTSLSAKLHPKRLELLKEAFPRISRVAILWSPPQAKHAMKEVEAVAQALGVQIQSMVTRDFDDIESALSAISQGRPDALLIGQSYFVTKNPVRIIEFAANRRLPAIYAGGGLWRGGLMSYTTDRLHLQRRVAAYVAKILKGAKPADLPVEQPTKFRLVINLKTAKALGLTIPPAVLLQATKVIK